MAKLKSLTPQQHDRMASWAQEWVEYGLRTEPLTDDEWRVWHRGVSKCYEYAGVSLPAAIVRVPSPLVGAFAAPIANHLLGASEDSVEASVRASVWNSVGASVRNSVEASVWDSVWASVGDSVRASVEDSVRASVEDSVRASVWDSVWASVQDSVQDSVRDSVEDSVGNSVGASVWNSVEASVRDSVRHSVGVSVDASVQDSVWGLVEDTVRTSVRASVWDSVQDSVWGLVEDAVRTSVEVSVRASVRASVEDSVWASVQDSVRASVEDSVENAVWDSVEDAVRASVRASVEDSVRASVRNSVEASVEDSVWASVGDSVENAVRNSVEASVEASVGDSVWASVRKNWSHYRGGRLWCSWEAYVSFFRDHISVDLGDAADRSRAYQDAQSASWWWPLRHVVMVCDMPTKIVSETVSGTKRLHCETGPAVEWPGFQIYAWHGVRVPGWVIDDPSVEKAMAETNTEIRRAAFEAIGWEKVVSGLGVEPIDVCADPGNSPHELALYRLPEKINPYGQPVNLLIMTNASPDRNGSLRRYGETVPSDTKSALEAAAWQYGVTSDVYAKIIRRT